MLSPSLPLGSPIWTMEELVVTQAGNMEEGVKQGRCSYPLLPMKGDVTLGSPRYGQGPLGPADIRSATRLPPQPPGPPGVCHNSHQVVSHLSHLSRLRDRF